MSKVRIMRQADLTEECWLVQMFGLKHCDSCEVKDTPECGGKRIRKTGKNKKGIPAPTGEKPEVVVTKPE